MGSGSGLIQRIYNDYNHIEAIKFIDNLQYLVTEYMKLSGFSVGIKDLIADNVTNKKISEAVLSKKEEVASLIQQLHLGTFENNSGNRTK